MESSVHSVATVPGTSETTHAAVPVEKTRVLLIEDDPPYVRVLQYCLSVADHGEFEIVHANRLCEGMEILQAGGIGVVLMDLNLPDSQGIESFEKVFAQAPDVPVVILSGVDDMTLSIEALDKGAQDYLVKARVNEDVIQRVIRYSLSRKRVAEELRHSEEQLLHAQKLESLGRLAGGIAHDFNNLLTCILGFGRLVLTELEEGHPARPDMEEILTAGERASSLTRQLLDFSRKQPVDVRALDLDVLVSGMEQLVRRTMGVEIELQARLHADGAMIRADQSRMEQLIMNLVVNACDAMTAGGKLTISTKRVILNHSFCRTRVGVSPGEYLLVSTQDTGCGIPEDIKPMIFEPFFTTKEEGRGTGLGLSTVYGIVKQFNGYIELESRVGKGTEVKAYFPCVDPDGETPDPRQVAKPRRGVGSILLAEDEDSLRHLSGRLLAQLGYNVVEAANGREALDAYESGKDTFDLVLTDIAMPVMNGPELVKRLREKHPDVKVVYVSGLSNAPAIARGWNGSEDRLLRKPFSKDQLAATVREALAADF